jgi:hypothetical protein
MIIEQTKEEIIFRLRKGSNIDDLQDLTDFLEFTERTKDFKAKQQDVDSLVKDIKKGRWSRTKAQLGE